MHATVCKIRRRALLIGIDRHLEAPALRSGCNDVTLVASVMQHSHDLATDIVTLTDEAATRKKILEALHALGAETGRHDALGVYFSGWAVRVPARDPTPAGVIVPWRETRPPASVAGTEYEGGLIPHDWKSSDLDSVIHYREIRDWLRGVQAGSVTLAFDVPYAGSLLGELPEVTDRVIYLGATAADERCYEFTDTGVAQRALTYFLCQALLRVEHGVTYRQMVTQVAGELIARYRFQHPVLEGAADQPVYGAGAAQPVRDAVVTARDGDAVAIGIGAAAGLTANSWWAIHPGGSEPIGSKTDRLGVIEITEVRPSDATGKIVFERSGPPIAPGTRAVEEAHDYGEMRLRVAVVPPPRGAAPPGSGSLSPPQIADLVGGLEARLAASEILRLTERDEPPDAVVRLVVPGGEVATGGPADRRRGFDAATWVVEDSQGRLLAEPRPARASASYDLRYDLQKLARYRNVLALTNPDLRGALTGKVELVVSRNDGERGWVAVDGDARTGPVVFHAGDAIRYEVENHHDQPIYASVLDFGVSMKMSTLFAGLRLAPGECNAVEASLYFPDDAPCESGIETLKLIATVYAIDLRSLLFQDGSRGVPEDYDGSFTELWQLIDMALTGRGSRERRPVLLPPEQEWTTVERAFELRRTGH